MVSGAGRFLFLLLAVAVAAVAADRQAERADRDGRRLEQQGKLREALEAYTRAAELAPRDPRFILHREMARQRAAFLHVSSGLRLMRRKQYAAAVREFEQAQEIDPSNDFTKQELARAREAAGLAETRREALEATQAGPELAPLLGLRPRPVRRSWDLRGEPRALYLALGAAYGIQFEFDDPVPSASARLRLEEADFSTAIRVLTAITNTFVAPLEERVAIVTADTTQKKQEFERQVLKTLMVGELATPEEINEVANVLRTVLEMPLVQPSLRQKMITVRGTWAKVQAAERLLRVLAVGRPEVLLELETLEVHTRRARELGLLALPQFTLFKLSPLEGQVQSGVAVPLPQLLGRAPAAAGAASQRPLAAFGGGRTSFGLTLPSADFRARLSESLVRGISTLTVRAGDNQTATFLVGERYPIINATFSPIFFSGAIEQQQRQGTLINPFPSFTFEELGIKLRLTARIHGDGEISLKVEAQVRSLTGQVFNGLPTLSNRQTEQIVRVRDGQPTLITGILSREERHSLAGTPFLAEAPVLGYLFGQRSQEAAETDVLLVVTPHIFREPPGALAARETIPLPSNYVPIAQ